MKILIADDHIEDRNLLCCTMENHGCETLAAGDGDEALAMAKLHKPDLIISDALMPCMDGFQLLRAVKLDQELKSIPFIFYSAVYTGFKEEELALSLGAEAFIVKPKEPTELWGAIASILKEKGSRKEHRAISGLKKEDEEFIRSYGEIVTTKLEEKIRELEAALLRRKEAEDALRDQFAAINTIFDAIDAIVFAADLDEGRILLLNRHGCQLFGDDWKGKKSTDLVPQERRKIMGITGADRHERQEMAQQPLTWEFRDGRTDRWYQCTERTIPWTDGRPARLTIAFDVSERKELERVKDAMISAVSHEMRTPLTAMIGFTEFMLGNEVPPPQQREYLLIIHKEMEKLNELIGNYLGLQRLQARHGGGGGFLAVDIREILQETATHYGTLSPRHQVIVDCPYGLPAIPGERRELCEMLDNLVSNAVKFSPAGGEVHLEACQKGNQITILVSDEGIGIPADMQEKVFERFYQVDSTDRRRFRGTGLGLALVREVVSAHGGKVWVESVVGKGSTFHVSLPLQPMSSRPTEP